MRTTKTIRFIVALAVGVGALVELCLTGKAALSWRLAHRNRNPLLLGERRQGAYLSMEGHGGPRVLTHRMKLNLILVVVGNLIAWVGILWWGMKGGTG